MNLELNVVKFNNCDVISTSCDPIATHYYVQEWPEGTFNAYETKLENGYYTAMSYNNKISLDPSLGITKTKSEYVEDVPGENAKFYVTYENMYYSYDGNTFYHCDKKHKGIEQAS